MVLSVQQRGSIFLVVTVCLLVVGICAPFSGHDLQRVMQIAIGFCAVLYGSSITPTEPWVDRQTAWGLALIVGLGLASSLLAHQPLWALTEMALFVSCAAIALAFASLRRHGGEPLDRVLLLIVVLLCLIKTLQYLYAGVLAFASGGHTMNQALLWPVPDIHAAAVGIAFAVTHSLSLIAGDGICVAMRLVVDRDQRRYTRHLARHGSGGHGRGTDRAMGAALVGLAIGGDAERLVDLLAGVYGAGDLPGNRQLQ
jgi:hypothetical protein